MDDFANTLDIPHSVATRRGLLRAGSLLTLGAAAGASAQSAAGGELGSLAGTFGSAKRCILIYLWGSPSQLDTFDPKPDAPREVRGELGSIPTVIPGVRFGEVLPLTAARADRFVTLRSLTHDQPIHGTAFATTSVPLTDLPLEGRVRDPRHWPYLGAVVDYLASRKSAIPPTIPRNFGLPFKFGSKRGASRPGFQGAFLGQAYDTVWADFQAKGIREVLRDSGAPGPKPMVADPYLGIRPIDRFEMGQQNPDVSQQRLERRLSLLDQFDGLNPSSPMPLGAYRSNYDLARSCLVTPHLKNALDVQQETAATRDRYGMTLFGQSCLAARRIIEAGGTFVTVIWDEYGHVNTGWDTHVHQTPRLRDELGPGFDHGYSSLLDDLQDRGLLDDTAVVVLSEHGRTPKLDNVEGGGRNHWPYAYSALLAGAGFARGRVVGRTDAIAGHVTETPFSPKDLVTTLYHVLGIDPREELHDHLGRPFPVGGIGLVRPELLG